VHERGGGLSFLFHPLRGSVMLVCPLEIPPELNLAEQEWWLLREIDRETLRHDSLECRVQRLYEALAIVQRAMRRE